MADASETHFPSSARAGGWARSQLPSPNQSPVKGDPLDLPGQFVLWRAVLIHTTLALVSCRIFSDSRRSTGGPCVQPFCGDSAAHQLEIPIVLMSNSLLPLWSPPDRMTPAQRLDELAQILAAGLIRMLGAQSSSLSPAQSQTVVDLPPPKSGGHRRKPHNRVGG